jgi:short subunit dehydrogenase-like uncharacterized protein
MTSRDYDVVVYGAGGFTGRQVVAYLAEHEQAGGLRWAVAGRHRDRLQAALAAAGDAARGVGVLVADSRDQRSVDAIAARTRVLLSTAGPFARYGTPVVDACVRFGTHYADITGETVWVRELVARHHERAAADGTRIVTCCGFDSVPSDLGAFLLARRMRALGLPCVEVRAYFQLRGAFNGGTIATALHGIETGALAGTADPFLLDPPGPRSRRRVERNRDLARPRHDAEMGAWVGPFFMAPTNTRVVRRSAALYAGWGAPYGPDFRYRECLRYDPPLAPLKAAVGTVGLALFGLALAWTPTRRLLTPLLPKPGTGPSPETMDRGWFTCELLGLAANGSRVEGLIAYDGDPGNRATVRFVAESALALALDADRLPGGPARGGILTPATALGDVLAERLRRAGVRIEIGGSAPLRQRLSAVARRAPARA